MKFVFRKPIKLYIAALFIGLFLVIYEVVLPFSRSLERHRIEVPQKKEQLAWMKNAASEVNLLRGGGGLIKDSDIQLSTLHETAGQNDLRSNIKRLEPDSPKKARVWMEAASFTDLISWMFLLEKKGITVTNFSADRLAKPGFVDAKITLQIKDQS